MKRAQVQMGENVIILFIFFILLVFAVVFYSRLQTTKTQQKIDIDVTGRGLQIAQRVAFLPEVQCTKSNAEIFSGCYDEFSLIALDSTAGQQENNEYYYDIFGYSLVSVKSIFPEDKEKLIIYNNTKPQFTSIVTTSVPITVCNFLSNLEDKGSCNFGVLKVEVYN